MRNITLAKKIILEDILLWTKAENHCRQTDRHTHAKHNTHHQKNYSERYFASGQKRKTIAGRQTDTDMRNITLITKKIILKDILLPDKSGKPLQADRQTQTCET